MFASQEQSQEDNYLLHFRAGKMSRKGTTVYADPRKGMVFMNMGNDGLMHFCWKERDTEVVEDDYVLLPAEFEYKRVYECNTGRVYVLKDKSSPGRYFFWLQEPSTSKDDEYCRRVNELINNPPPAHPAGALESLLNQMTDEQLLQFLGEIGLYQESNSADESADDANASSPQPSTNPLVNDPVYETTLSTGKKMAIYLPQIEHHEAINVRDKFASVEYKTLLNQFCIAFNFEQPITNNIVLTADSVRATLAANLNDLRKALEAQLPNNAKMP